MSVVVVVPVAAHADPEMQFEALCALAAPRFGGGWYSLVMAVITPLVGSRRPGDAI